MGEGGSLYSAAFRLHLVILACGLRRYAPKRAARVSVLTEIVFLFIVAILHNRLPNIAGTLGLSLVAAFQTVSFPRMEGLSYNSVMVTSNFRQTIEGLFAALAGSTEARPFRRPAFGVGAAAGAFATEATRNYSLVIPVMLLVLVLVHCELDARDAARAPIAKA